MIKKEYSLEVGGKTLKASFTDLADQASGSVLLSYGNTTILATAVMDKNAKDGSWFPLTVEFEERFYAAGKILGSRFMRREGRPSDEAILAGRVVDRTIRPLFDQNIRHSIQVVATVLSIGEDDPDVLGVIGASLALSTSNIPFNGPVSSVRIGIKNNEVLVNPNYVDRDSAELTLDLTACGKDGNINMIEVASKEVTNEVVTDALKKASEEIEKIQEWQKMIVKEIGKAKREIEFPKAPEGMKELFGEFISPIFKDRIFVGVPGKGHISELHDEWLAIYKEKFPEEKTAFADEYFEEQLNDLIHKEAIENNKRPDGRTPDQLRPLFSQAGGVSSVLHGTGIFYRGGTHILSVLTLGGPGEAQTIDSMESQTEKRFMHHYNFPPYSVGETGRMGGLNRRMIGHGHLAEKALLPILPAKENFPYTIRIVSEALASNGSTSMGSVCGSSLALMDAGVPVSRAVAGIASGIMMESADKYCLLTDIQGPEDHHGDMDFKVAGTREGITAVQMDVKVDGIPVKILGEALKKAEIARMQILDVMDKAISAPRADINPNAPKILQIMINPDKIGLVIGTGGKTIKEIMKETGATIDIEDDGSVYFTGKDGSADAAKKIVEEMTREYKKGDKFDGAEVIKLMDFGAFVRIGNGSEGLVHVSEIAPFRVENVSDYLKAGDIVPVVIKDIDDKGRLSLSIKQMDPNFFKQK